MAAWHVKLVRDLGGRLGLVRNYHGSRGKTVSDYGGKKGLSKRWKPKSKYK